MNCEHKQKHTQMITKQMPVTDKSMGIEIQSIVIATYCADCGKFLKMVDVNGNTKE